MRKDDNTEREPVRPRRVPYFDGPLKQWSNLPITQERARELVDALTRHDDSESTDALLQLICGLMPHPLSDDKYMLDERFLAGLAALKHGFALTHRAENELGAYVVHLQCAEWE
jgi:hypothetical protein